MPFPRNMVEVCEKCFPIDKGQDDTSETSASSGPARFRCSRSIHRDHVHTGRERPELSRAGPYLDRPGQGPSSFLRSIRGKGPTHGQGRKIDVHHPFHALENAFLQVSLGKDYVLYTDSTLVSLVGSDLAKVEKKVGLRINVQFSGHGDLEIKNGKDPIQDR